MIEKVNPKHPDKIADRIAGAIVDLAYTKSENPKVAVEVLIGHGDCNIIIESSVIFDEDELQAIIERIAESDIIAGKIKQVPQDVELAKNQEEKIRCGDNGIFKGMPLTREQKIMSEIAHTIYDRYNSDGKYILDGINKLIICQSNAKNTELYEDWGKTDIKRIFVNPLGEWTGGTDVDTGATNRKLGSDMGEAVTGGGLHGKDLSKADVSVNIYAFLKAQETGKPVELCCAIGDETIDGKPYSEIVEIAREFIQKQGGFEKFAEWRIILR
jgi:S-adenosylmethionine synthetase